MPTASKIVAAIFFALLGYFCGDLVRPLLPEGTRTGFLNATLAVLGFLSGWRMSGSRAGDGMKAALGFGLTTCLIMAFWGIFAFAGYEMLQMSMDRRFGTPTQAIKGMIDIGIEYAKLVSVKEILVPLVIGGLFGGWLTEWTSRRWS